MPSQKEYVYQNVKMVTVGFDGSGKTSMYHTFTRKEFPADYVPICFEGYAQTLYVDGKCICLCFWDTCCGENDEYGPLRPLSYHDTDVFVLCYDVSNFELFPWIKTFWVDKELRPFDPKIPIILVATKIDLRGRDCKTVCREEGEALAEEIGAAGYFEISSLKMEGLEELFRQICIVALRHRKEKLKKNCLIL